MFARFPKRHRELVFYAFFLILFSACATIVHTPYQKVNIKVSPHNSKIYCNQAFVGKDSVCLKLKRNRHYIIHLENDSCIHKDIHLIPQTSNSGGWFYVLDSVGGLLSFINPTLGGLTVFIAVSIDFVTGSYYTLHPYSRSAKDVYMHINLQKHPCYVKNN